MGAVTTSTLANPLQPAGVSGIDRQNQDGVLWVALLNNASNGVNYHRSTNGGTSWALAGSWTIGTTVHEISGLHITEGGELWLAYRTAETDQDRLYVRRCTGTATAFNVELPLQISEPGNSGVAGSIHTGLDVMVVGWPSTGTARVVVAAGTTYSGLIGVTLHGVDQAANGTLSRNNNIITGKRQWMYPGTAGRTTPQMDIEHWGTGKEAGVPHLWCVFGRQELRVVKLAWTGSTWAGPPTTVLLRSGVAPVDAIPGRWDGHRFLMAVPNPDFFDRVLVAEQDASNTRTTWRFTPPIPTGLIRNCTLSYNSENGDFRIFAVGTSSAVLHFVDFVRASGTWTSWGTVTGTAILGTTAANYGVRHESAGNARYDVVTAHSGSPNTITSIHQVLAYAPNTPTWDVQAIGVDNGAAASVSSPLNLDWTFSDPDPADVQSAWALSRQVGTGTARWYRASDLTWQDTEQKNLGVTTAATLMNMVMWDSFTRIVAGGVGTADSGHTWAVDGTASQFSVNGNTLQIALSALNTTWRARVTSVSYSAVDVSLMALLPVAPVGAYARVEAIVRFVDASNYYAFRCHVLPSGAVDLQLIRLAGGVETTLAGVSSGVTYTAGMSLMLRAQMVGTALRGRVWRDGTTEPSSWQITSTDATHATGTVGVAALLPPGNTNTLPLPVLIDNFAVGAGTQGWASSTAEAPHTYKVKVWDSTDLASVYSDAFVVIPSGLVNPTITTPAASQVLSDDSVTVTWTVAEQTAYRVRLQILSDVVHDSGWVAGTATSYTPDYALGDGFSYTVVLQTRNLEGLASDEQQRTFSVDFVEPAVATLTASPLPDLGVIRVQILNPASPGPLNANPYFESNATAWTGTDGTIARSTSQAHEGVASLLLTPSGSGANPRAESTPVSVTAGALYRVSAWTRCAVARNVEVNISWYTAGSVFISTSVTTVPVLAGTWTAAAAYFVAPPTAGLASVQVRMTGTPPNTHLLHVDEAMIRDGVPEVASVDLYRRPVLYPYLREHHFETADMSGWGTPHAGAAVRTNTRAHQGSWSYQLTSDGTDPLGSYVETVKMPCTAGVTYFLDMWVAGPVTRTTIAQVRWYNAGGTFLSASNGIAKKAPMANAWDYRWAAATAPAGATQMTLCAVVDSVPANGDVIWVDEVRVRVSDPELGVRVAAGLSANAVVDDWRAVSGVPYEYRAQVRSVIGTTVGGVWTA